MKTRIVKDASGDSEFDMKFMSVKLSEVIAVVEKHLKSKTDFIKKIDLSSQWQYTRWDSKCAIVIISNEGQYFKLSEEDGILKTKDHWSQRNSKLVSIKKFA